MCNPKMSNQYRINDDRAQDAWKNYGQTSLNFEKPLSAYSTEESKKDKWAKSKVDDCKVKKNF